MQIEKTGFKSKKKLRKSGKHNYVKELFTVLLSLEKKKRMSLGYTFGHLGVCFHGANLVCPDTLFLQTMWKGLLGLQCDTDNVIHTALNSCSPSISISIIEPSCCTVGSLACNASAVYSAYWGAAWQFQFSRDALEGIST